MAQDPFDPGTLDLFDEDFQSQESLPEVISPPAISKAAPQLSPQGKALLKAMGGSEKALSFSDMAQKRFGLDKPDPVLMAMPPELSQAALGLEDKLLLLSSSDLEKRAIPNSQDRRIRIKFWEEFELANRQLRPMDMEKVVEHTGAPSWPAYFMQLKYSPEKLAWLVTPPPSYDLRLKEGSEIGMNRLIEILELPMMEGSKVNTKVGMLILNAIKLIENRRQGSIVQRTMNLHANLPADTPKSGAVDELDAKLKAIEKQLGEAMRSQSPPGEQEAIETEGVPLSPVEESAPSG